MSVRAPRTEAESEMKRPKSLEAGRTQPGPPAAAVHDRAASLSNRAPLHASEATYENLKASGNTGGKYQHPLYPVTPGIVGYSYRTSVAYGNQSHTVDAARPDQTPIKGDPYEHEDSLDRETTEKGTIKLSQLNAISVSKLQSRSQSNRNPDGQFVTEQAQPGHGTI